MPDLAPVPPRYFRSSIPRAEGIDDYEPRDARSRADAYTQWAGISDGWPIPLTRIGEPAQADNRSAKSTKLSRSSQK